MKNGFIFYRSFFEAIKDLPDKNRLELYDAIFEYGLNLTEPKLSGINLSLWKLIRPQIEANNRKYDNGSKPKNKQTGSKQEANRKQTTSKPEAKEKEKEKEKVKEKDKEKANASVQNASAHESDFFRPEPPAPEPNPRAESFAEWFLTNHDPRPEVETTIKRIRHIRAYEQLTDLNYQPGDIVRALAYSMGGEATVNGQPRTYPPHPIWSKAVRTPAHLLETDSSQTRKLDKVLAAMAAEDRNDPIEFPSSHF